MERNLLDICDVIRDHSSWAHRGVTEHTLSQFTSHIMNTDYTTLQPVSPVLTSEFLSGRLTEWFSRSLLFTRWEYVGEAGKGDSFFSELIRIKIYGEDASGDKEESIQLILKTIPKKKCRRLTYRLDEFFRNEIQLYQHVLPELLKFQSKRNPKEPFDQCAKIFAAHIDGINDVLALEDLSLQNYGSAIRQEGLDYDHCKVVMRTFAKYHAISFAMKDQEPETFDSIKGNIFETCYRPDLWSWYGRYWQRLCDIAIEAVEKEYPDSIYVEKVKEVASPAIYPKMIEAVSSSQEHAVISHGDSWTNNFLFKYQDSTKPLDAKMIDFQYARCANPVLDISFFIYACTTQDLRKEYYESMLRFYHDQLSHQIRDLGSDPETLYSWDVFMVEIKKYSYFGLALSFESTPFIVLDPEDAPSLDMEGEEKMNMADVFTIQPLKTKKARLREADNVVHCVDLGYI